MMRLLLAIRGLWHSWRALRLTKAAQRCMSLAARHDATADYLLARSRGLVSAAPSARPCPAGFILLAAIVGMAICAMWIAITWRAVG